MFLLNIYLFLDIEEVQLISKHKIKFPDTKSLTIKYNNKGLEEMKELISNAFPSQLSSFTFICVRSSLLVFYSRFNYYFNFEDRFRCLECLQTTNSSILIQNFIFNKPKQLCDSIQFFKKASSIEFRDCYYKDCEVGMEDIKFEVVMINNITFTDCCFENTKIIEKVIIDSGLANKLDKVTFNCLSKGKEDVEKMVQEYQNETKKNNLEIM